MSRTTKAAATVLALLLAVTVMASARPAVALGADDPEPVPVDTTPTTVGEPEATGPTTAPPDGETSPEPTTEPDQEASVAPRTSVAEAGTDDLVADTPTTDDTTDLTHRTQRVPVVTPRDPRWVDLSGCGLDALTCAIARMHQANGHFMWQGGEVFLTHDGRRVQGSPAHTWPAYQQQAQQLAAYLRAVDQARLEDLRRQDLVRRWSGVAHCESGGNWGAATGNGYYGGLQFGLSTWRAYGGQGYPHQQPAWYQAEVADRIRVSSGLHHWPHCGRYYG